MRRERLARALLKLYPPAWRERYGDELLAFLDDSGLTVRAVMDVASAATVERVRSLVAFAQGFDERATIPADSSWSVREFFIERAAILGFFGLVVLLLGAVGVPFPYWRLSLQFALFGLFLDSERVGTLVERLALRAFEFALAVTATGLVWFTAILLVTVGVPAPSGRLVAAVAGIVIGCGGLRLLYLGVRCFRPLYAQFRSPGISVEWPRIREREMRVWASMMIGIVTLVAITDPQAEFFWHFALLTWICVRIWSDRRALRRQQLSS